MQTIQSYELTACERQQLEELADKLEGIARNLKVPVTFGIRSKLFSLAWDIKQIARRGTPSFGI